MQADRKILRKILAKIVAGLGQALTVVPGRSYVQPARQPFRKDASALQHDAKSIADNLNRKFRQ